MEIVGVSERAFEILTEKIILGELQGGDRLNEVGLTKSMSISRPPFREALRRLESHHLAVNMPRIGSFVKKLSLGHFLEVQSARQMIENHAIDILISDNLPLHLLHRSIEQTSKELPFLKQQEDKNPNGLIRTWRTLTDFHFKLIESSENSYLTEFYKTISLSLARYHILLYKVSDRREKYVDEHVEVLGYIEKGELELAKRRLGEHLDRVLKVLRPTIEKKE